MRTTFHDLPEQNYGADNFNPLPPIPDSVDDFQTWLYNIARGEYAANRKSKPIIETADRFCALPGCDCKIIGRGPRAIYCSIKHQHKADKMRAKERHEARKAGAKNE